MWDKIVKIGIKAGKAYIASRGVDGAIEDAQKVFGWAKKGASDLFSSNEVTEDGLSGLDFDKVQEITDDCIAEMKSNFQEAKRYEITDTEFFKYANIALYTGYYTISQMFDLGDEINGDDFDTLMSTYWAQIESFCNEIHKYISQQCTGTMNPPVDLQIGDEEGEICMKVYGVSPVDFDCEFTRLVVRITNGIIEPGSKLILTDDKCTVAEIQSIQMFGKTLDGASAGDLCSVLLKGDFIDILPDDCSFQIGKMPEIISESETGNSISVREKHEEEYLEEYKACLEDDGKISPKERRLLNRLRESLGISEERVQELEDSCNNNHKLTDEELEYANEVNACLEEDGKISEKEHRLLDRLAKSLGISIERARLIEDLVDMGRLTKEK